jgi:hypothetical protein
MWNHVDVGLDTVVEIAGLEPYSSYAFRVRAVSDTTYDTRVDPKERGYLEGALSETVVAYALPRPKPGSPRSVHVNGKFHGQGDAKWIVIRGQLRGHNDTLCGGPAPSWPIGRPGSGRPQGIIVVF